MGRLREGTNEEEDDGASPVPVPVKKAGGGGGKLVVKLMRSQAGRAQHAADAGAHAALAAGKLTDADVQARRGSAEHPIATKAPRCTATAGLDSSLSLRVLTNRYRPCPAAPRARASRCSA